MRTTFASALAICGVLLTASTLHASPAQTAAQAAPAKPQINLNTATVDQLETLPGIGQKTAELIVEFRTNNGGFKRIEDLMNIKGIGEKSFLKLKPLITVSTDKTERASGK
jgi:competence protein ComEA